MSTAEIVLLVNSIATWFMCGVIWFVQVVHYPMFGCFRRDDFLRIMLEHQARTTRIVVGPMLLELVSSIALVVIQVDCVIFWIGLALVGVWGFSTVLLQIPSHNQLSLHGYDTEIHRRLVRTNWLRVFAWTARSVLCAALVFPAFAS